MAFWNKKKPLEVAIKKASSSYFSTHVVQHRREPTFTSDIFDEIASKQPIFKTGGSFAMDDSSNGYPNFKTYNNAGQNISEALLMWYASQGFIGHQLAGIIAQHWLVNKACSMPGDDAVRNGFNVVATNGDPLDPEITKLIQTYDKKYAIKSNMREFMRKGRIFGVRLAMFKVQSTDPEYYEKPFNIDGVAKNSYKGIAQIDPYWTAPMLDGPSASEPGSLHFYEPTWWMINGKKVHRTHLIIFRNAEPVDVLKPQYLYGGIPVPQQIMERVYAAERVANEAPLLVETKRTNVWLTDMGKVMADSEKTIELLDQWATFRDNYGIKLGDKEGDEFQQFDTSLADLDAVIMTQYQICAAVANVPATKLLGTSPKGFGASGEYEEASYHEFLETLQEFDLTPLAERHHALVIKSFSNATVETTISWNTLDTPTEKEHAEINKIKADTGLVLVQSGAIDSADEQMRVATDPYSGYDELGKGVDEDA